MTRCTPIGRARRVMGCLAAALMCVGCSGPILRPQSPEARLDLPPMPDVKYVSEYTHPYGMNFAKIEALQNFAEKRGHTLLELAVSWLAAHPCVTSVIAGATTPEQIRANAAAANWKLSTAELAEIGALAPLAPA